MINKVKIHIPINTMEQIVIRDEVAKSLTKDYKVVVLSLIEAVKLIDKKPYLFPVSVVTIYIEELTDEDISYFKELTTSISRTTGDNILLEITREILYMGTAIMED